MIYTVDENFFSEKKFVLKYKYSLSLLLCHY